MFNRQFFHSKSRINKIIFSLGIWKRRLRQSCLLIGRFKIWLVIFVYSDIILRETFTSLVIYILIQSYNSKFIILRRKIICTLSALIKWIVISAELRMFRKFDEKESISAVSQLKTSVQKGIRNQVTNFVLTVQGSKRWNSRIYTRGKSHTVIVKSN